MSLDPRQCAVAARAGSLNSHCMANCAIERAIVTAAIFA